MCRALPLRMETLHGAGRYVRKFIKRGGRGSLMSLSLFVPVCVNISSSDKILIFLKN